MSKTKSELVAELNARLSVEVVDLDTELQHFLRLIRELRQRAQEDLAEAYAELKTAKDIKKAKAAEMLALKSMGEITKMLERAVSMEIRISKDKKARQAKLKPSEYLDGAARYILSQPTVIRNAWLADVCKKHLEIRALETGAHRVPVAVEAVLGIEQLQAEDAALKDHGN